MLIDHDPQPFFNNPDAAPADLFLSLKESDPMFERSPIKTSKVGLKSQNLNVMGSGLIKDQPSLVEERNLFTQERPLISVSPMNLEIPKNLNYETSQDDEEEKGSSAHPNQ